MNLKVIITKHIETNFESHLRQRIKTLVSVGEVDSPLTISIFNLIFNGFTLKGKAFLTTKIAWKNSVGEGVDDVPIGFKFSLTVADGEIRESEIEFDIEHMPVLIFKDSVVSVKTPSVNKRKNLVG